MAEVLAVALCRVSSIEQLLNNSLNQQKGNVLREAERLGARIPEDAVWEGAVSSKKGVNYKRKDLLQIVEYCKKHSNVKYLIVQEVDRFMRSPDEQIYWQVELWYKFGVKVWYADKPELNEDTHVASLLRYMEGWRAGGSNEERKNKSINGQTTALKEGRYTFHPKPGYMKGTEAGVHEIHPTRGRALQKVLKRLAAGYTSPTNALKELNKSAFTKDHAHYKMDKFSKIAIDIYYAGLIEMNKQVKVNGVRGRHEQLITLKEHYLLLDIFNKRPKYQMGPKRKGNPEFPLNNLLENDECLESKNKGRLVGFDHSNGRYKKLYAKYRCRSCGKYWHKGDAHQEVIKLFDRYEMNEDTQQKILDALDIVWSEDAQSKVQDIHALKANISDLEADIERKVESLTEAGLEAVRQDMLRIIEKKKVQLNHLNSEIIKLISEEEEDKRQFMTFALGFIHDTGRHFLEPYISKENRMSCKQMLFPAGIYINAEGKVYTPKVSIFFGGNLTKKDAEASNNSHMVRVKRL